MCSECERQELQLLPLLFVFLLCLFGRDVISAKQPKICHFYQIMRKIFGNKEEDKHDMISAEHIFEWKHTKDASETMPNRTVCETSEDTARRCARTITKKQ